MGIFFPLQNRLSRIRSHTRPRFRPRLDTLEDRLLLSLSPVFNPPRGQGDGSLVDNCEMPPGTDGGAIILDNGDPGFTATPGFFAFDGQGYQGDVHFAAAGLGGQQAHWNFTNLTPGLYRISATWTPDPNRSTFVLYTVLNGVTPLSPVFVNQQLSPAGFSDAGASWQDLGGLYAVSTGSVTIRLDNVGNGYIIADAIRIERLDDLPFVQVIDNSASDAAGFSVTPGFDSFDGQGFSGTVAAASPGSGGAIASWVFAVTPGVYQVSATWSAHANRATDAPFTIRDGSTSLGTVLVNQTQAPSSFDAGGAAWSILGGPYTITSGVLTVLLTNNADGYVIADAIRIERLA